MKINGVETIKAHIATNINEYLNIVKKHFVVGTPWFRGQSLSSYRLEPSIFRTKNYYSNLLGRVGEKMATRPSSGNFHLMDHTIALNFMKKHYDNKKLSNMDIVHKNQHNGIPTPLLDFTTDPLIALFFCVENKKYWNNSHSKIAVKKELGAYGEYCDLSGAVSVIDPIHTNKETCGVNKIFKKEDEINKYFKMDLPFAIDPKIVDKRMKAQKGKFLCFGGQLKEYECYNPLRKRLLKIHIPNNCKEDIFYKLRSKDVAYNTVYPDIEGFVKEAKLKMEEEFDKRCKLHP